MKKIVILIALFTAVLFAQVVPGRYVIELAGEPAAGAKHGMRSAMRESEFAARRDAVRQTQAAARSAVANLGG